MFMLRRPILKLRLIFVLFLKKGLTYEFLVRTCNRNLSSFFLFTFFFLRPVSALNVYCLYDTTIS